MDRIGRPCIEPLQRIGETGSRCHPCLYRKPPQPVEDSIEKRVLIAGVKASDQFHLDHVLKFSQASTLWEIIRDLSNLIRYLFLERVDILNVHYSRGHILGGIATRRAFGFGGQRHS